MTRGTGPLDVGIAFDLRTDFRAPEGAPEDLLEEYDSDATVAAIEAALREAGHRPRRMGGGRRFVEEAMRRPPQLVFNIAEGSGGTRSREAHVPAVCEMLGVPFTHSDPLTLAATLDKAVAKRIVASCGVPTPRFAVVSRPEDADRAGLALPVIAKPLFEGSSMGIRRTSRAADAAALRTEVARLVAGYREPVLLEEFCPGAEFTVGVLGTGASAAVVAAMEVVPRVARPEEFVYSLEAKRNWREEVEYHVPPRRPADVVRAVESVALAAYRALDCRDVGRVDVRIGADGEPKFLEVNPLPGLHPETGDLPILARRSGVPYAALVARIVDGARERLGV